MSKIFLINVGANTSHENRARSPILRNDTWTYVPFPRDKESEHGEDYPDSAAQCVRVPNGLKCHLDPDWDRLTYGDSCHEPPGRSLLKVQDGDILLFWALLWKVERNEMVFESREKGWYLIGALRTSHILKGGERLGALPNGIRQRAEHKAHVLKGQVRMPGTERVFVGNLEHSRRFTQAVDLEVGRNNGLMHRVVRTSKGDRVCWNKPPRWYSLTRFVPRNPQSQGPCGSKNSRVFV
jgi:Nucleotide modification associated domain 3